MVESGFIEAYHGTSNLKSVMKNGYIKTGVDGRDDTTLDAYDSTIEVWDKPAVFLTDSPREAAHYAGESLPPDWISAVIKVRIPTAWVDGVQHGREHGFGFAKSTWYIVERRVPKEYFVAIKTLR